MADEDTTIAAPDLSAASLLALGAASRARADAFLDSQTELARLQADDLRREDAVRHWSLRIRHVSDVMKLAFELAVALIVLAIASSIAGAIWSAAHDNGLVIEAFSVPPDMASRGLTGQVVAAQLQDKLTAMQNATQSGRPAASYASNWGNDIKVEIPNTGVSIGEAYRYLAGWLGNETHISGEVFHTAKGVVVTARAGAAGSTTVAGADGDLDALIQQTAEKIYEQTQPYRYAIYLQDLGPQHNAESRAVLERLVATGSARDRAWAHMALGNLDQEANDFDKAIGEDYAALALEPGLVLAYVNIDFSEGSFGHDEASLAAARKAVALYESGDDVDISDVAGAASLQGEKASVAFGQNDFQTALRAFEATVALPDYSNSEENARDSIPTAYALLHDGAGFRQSLRDMPASRGVNDDAGRLGGEQTGDYWLGNWKAVIALRPRFEALSIKSFATLGFTRASTNSFFAHQEWPYVATAMAMLGDVKGAHALIDTTPADCYACVRNRANIDAIEKNWNGAAYWFARAVAEAPSIPIGYEEWGRMLLEKGDVTGAIAKLSLAHDKGPHFADPLVYWGEALMKQNHSDLALAKFEEAARDAPNWGRLHLKWGEALLYAGDRDEAVKQFAIAARLDLSAAEAVELGRSSPAAR